MLPLRASLVALAIVSAPSNVAAADSDCPPPVTVGDPRGCVATPSDDGPTPPGRVPHPIVGPSPYLSTEAGISIAAGATSVPRRVFATGQGKYLRLGLEERFDGVLAFHEHIAARIGIFGRSDVGGNAATIASQPSTFSGGARFGFALGGAWPSAASSAHFWFNAGITYEAAAGYALLPARAVTFIPTAGSGDPQGASGLLAEGAPQVIVPYRSAGIYLPIASALACGPAWSFYGGVIPLFRRRTYDASANGNLIDESVWGIAGTAGAAWRPAKVNGGLQLEFDMGVGYQRWNTLVDREAEELKGDSRLSTGATLGAFFQSSLHPRLRAALSGTFRCGVTPSETLGIPRRRADAGGIGCAAPAANQYGGAITLRYVFDG